MPKGYGGVKMSYTPVEYIESSGTQYIDTGVPASATLKTLCDMSTTTGGYPFGVTPAQNAKYYGAAVHVNNHGIQSYFGTTNNYTTVENIWTQGQRFVIIANDNYKFYKDNTQIADYATGTTKEFDSSLPITIFALNGLYLSSRITMKLYGFKMYDNGTLIRDFIPVINQDNVACLYEQIEGKFYYNKGTGAFSAGSTTGSPVVIGDKARKIIKGYAGKLTFYTPVEYIESTGTQYIDTAVHPSADIQCVFDFQITDTSVRAAITGGWQSNSGMLFGINNGNFQFAFGTSAWAGNTLAADTNRHIVYMNDENGDGKLDNTVLASHSDVVSLNNSSKNIFICAADGYGYPSGFTAIKVYFYKIYENGTLIRDFIPVKNQDNVACLYDLVEGKFYYNKGTGTFIAGSATGQAVSLEDKARKIIKGYAGVNGVARLIFPPIPAYTPLSYIEGNGTQYIDTEVFINDNTCVDVKFQNTRTSSNDYLCGADNPLYHIGGISGNYLMVSANGGDYYKLAWADTSIHTIVYNDINKKIRYDGNIFEYGTATIPDSLTSMYLFTKNPASGTRRYTKVYYCKISNRLTGELYRDLIPVIRQEDNVVCLFDKVSNKFFVNKGTGNFIAGPVMT